MRERTQRPLILRDHAALLPRRQFNDSRIYQATDGDAFQHFRIGGHVEQSNEVLIYVPKS